MEWWHVYLFTRLDGLNLAVGLLCAASVIALVVYFLVSFTYEGGGSTTYSEDLEMRARMRSNIPKYAVIPVMLGFLYVAIPTQKEAAAIYLLPKLAHSDFAKEAQQLPTLWQK